MALVQLGARRASTSGHRMRLPTQEANKPCRLPWHRSDFLLGMASPSCRRIPRWLRCPSRRGTTPNATTQRINTNEVRRISWDWSRRKLSFPVPGGRVDLGLRRQRAMSTGGGNNLHGGVPPPPIHSWYAIRAREMPWWEGWGPPATWDIVAGKDWLIAPGIKLRGRGMIN